MAGELVLHKRTRKKTRQVSFPAYPFVRYPMMIKDVEPPSCTRSSVFNACTRRQRFQGASCRNRKSAGEGLLSLAASGERGRFICRLRERKCFLPRMRPLYSHALHGTATAGARAAPLGEDPRRLDNLSAQLKQVLARSVFFAARKCSAVLACLKLKTCTLTRCQGDVNHVRSLRNVNVSCFASSYPVYSALRTDRRTDARLDTWMDERKHGRTHALTD